MNDHFQIDAINLFTDTILHASISRSSYMGIDEDIRNFITVGFVKRMTYWYPFSIMFEKMLIEAIGPC